jgi:hypothetical protein
MRVLILLSTILMLLSSSHTRAQASQETYSWWLNTEFDLDCNKAFNAFLKDDGCYSLLNRENITQKNSDYLKQIDSLGLVFKTKTQLSTTGEYVAVGIFSNSQTKGRFLVIAEDPELKKILKLFKREGSKGFSAIHAKNKEVTWFFCMECGDSESLIKSPNSYLLE